MEATLSSFAANEVRSIWLAEGTSEVGGDSCATLGGIRSLTTTGPSFAEKPFPVDGFYERV